MYLLAIMIFIKSIKIKSVSVYCPNISVAVQKKKMVTNCTEIVPHSST